MEEKRGQAGKLVLSASDLIGCNSVSQSSRLRNQVSKKLLT